MGARLTQEERLHPSHYFSNTSVGGNDDSSETLTHIIEWAGRLPKLVNEDDREIELRDMSRVLSGILHLLCVCISIALHNYHGYREINKYIYI